MCTERGDSSTHCFYVCLDNCPEFIKKQLNKPFNVAGSVSMSAARVASHGCVLRVWRGRKGGHGGLSGGEIQPVSDGVYHLQRDHPPKLPEGGVGSPLPVFFLFLCFM